MFIDYLDRNLYDSIYVLIQIFFGHHIFHSYMLSNTCNYIIYFYITFIRLVMQFVMPTQVQNLIKSLWSEIIKLLCVLSWSVKRFDFIGRWKESYQRIMSNNRGLISHKLIFKGSRTYIIKFIAHKKSCHKIIKLIVWMIGI